MSATPARRISLSHSTFGDRLTLRCFSFVATLEWDYVSLHEWGVYLTLERRHRDWLRVSLGPGVIPF